MLGFSEEISKKMGHEKVKTLGQYPFQGSLVTTWGVRGSSFIYSFNKHGASGVHRDNTAMPSRNFQSIGKRGLKLKQINTISRVAVGVLKLVIRVL